ncbi:MAG: Ni/Fe-hydrogenase cytochrome b subunit [Myxococcota bacterium]
MNEHLKPAPVSTVKFFTPGVLLLLAVIAVGLAFAAYRFLFGIGAISNLDDRYPWGIWIGIDVATGVALAAGGFTTSALVHIFHREQFHAVVRPALLTAMLGYTFVGIGLIVDLGKYYYIWHPLFMWQGNSVLFEVGMCVMAYLTVLYIEFLPIIVERFKDGVKFPSILGLLDGLATKFLSISDAVLGKIMFIFIILGVVLSCMHQSSLGALMLIAPTKMHPLWFTPILPLLFLFSAIAVGYPMVIFESLIASNSLKLKPEMEVISPLSKFIPFLLGIYMFMKISDMAIRETYVYLLDGSIQSSLFIVEMLFGLVLPFTMLLFEKARSSPKLLFTSVTLIILGVALNRVNVFLVAYAPPYAEKTYFPTIGEIAVTAALISTLLLIYRFVVQNFPVIVAHPKKE